MFLPFMEHLRTCENPTAFGQDLNGQWNSVRGAMFDREGTGPGYITRIDYPQFDVGGTKEFDVDDIGYMHQYLGGVEAFEQLMVFLMLFPCYQKTINRTGYSEAGMIFLLNLWSNLFKRLVTSRFFFRAIGVEASGILSIQSSTAAELWHQKEVHSNPAHQSGRR